MKLHSESWLVKWAYFMLTYTPRQVNLCEFFWRVVLLTPVKLGAIGFILSVAFFVLFYMGYIKWGWKGVLVIPAILTIGGLLIWPVKKAADRLAMRPPKEPGLLIQYLRAKKQKFCPIIDIKRD